MVGSEPTYLDVFFGGQFVLPGVLLDLPVPDAHPGVEVDLELALGLLRLLGQAQVDVDALAAGLQLPEKNHVGVVFQVNDGKAVFLPFLTLTLCSPIDGMASISILTT